MLRMRRLLRRPGEGGAATVEFIFVGVLTLVPLFYAVIAFFSVQADVFATTHAAREAGRTFATAPDVPTGMYRAQYSVRLAYENSGGVGDTELRFVALDTPCDAGGPAAPDPGVATLEPGAIFAVCVVHHLEIPAVPSFLDGGSNTVTARYEVYVDDFSDRRERTDSGGSGVGS